MVIVRATRLQLNTATDTPSLAAPLDSCSTYDGWKLISDHFRHAVILGLPRHFEIE